MDFRHRRQGLTTRYNHNTIAGQELSQHGKTITIREDRDNNTIFINQSNFQTNTN
ncbi:uncharacterized protein MELLADRAFT_91554 [Melampsora larici-populina 98AG31]|uniref:Uncharacterized protein n=1 Tax=Melampsora larici-populina (strain 98AG31 / pathotype 3-4-7) TaxID=747676 RepID=F4RZG9_MELLP|nr:uncharacterized protein MELLADRAFT_91554 [Melampsora larici-populina 98AG31]EGG02256.1 hypothetical protein MELLADRAFT_91554 [Melampsora larici-populina 98AG31]